MWFMPIPPTPTKAKAMGSGLALARMMPGLKPAVALAIINSRRVRDVMKLDTPALLQSCGGAMLS